MAAVLAMVGMAAGLHAVFCEWRRFEYAAQHASEVEGLVLIPWRRIEHPEGNRIAWDARRDRQRAYHADWVACWNREPGSDACSRAAPEEANPTHRAVLLRECAEAREIRAPHSASFAACLRERGHPEVQAPRWTSELIGPRFEGPYITLTGLWAEDFGLPPGVGRALGWLRGVVIPALLCVGALWLLFSARRPRPSDAGRGAR